MADVLREFFISIGIAADDAAARKAEGVANRVEKTVTGADARMTKGQVAGSAERIIVANREAGVRTKGAAAHIAEMKAQQEADRSRTQKDVANSQQRIRENRQEAQSVKDKSASSGLALAAFAATAVAVATVAAKAITGMAENLSQLYYSGQRTNSSVKGLQAFGFAAEQLGSNAKEAIGFVEHLAELMKSAPGYEDMLKGMGINTRDANGKLKERVELASELQGFLSKLPDHQARAYAGALGMPTHLLEALTSGKFGAQQAQAKSILAQVGVDPDKAAKESEDFMQVLRRLQFTLTAIGIKIEGELVKRFGGALENLQSWLISNGDSITKAFVKIGDGLLVVVKAVGEFAKKLENLSPQQRDFLVQMGALVAAFLAFNSGPIGALVAITAAMVAFLDDEKLQKLQQMWDKFDALTKRLTGQDGLTVAFELLGAALLLKVLKPFDSLITKLIWLGGYKLPAWILGMLGVGPTAVAAAAVGTAIAADRAVPNEQKPGLQNYQDDERSGAAGGAGMWGAIKRAGRWIGGKIGIGGATDGIHRRGARAAAEFGRLNARASEGPGKYRPVYALGEADLSQRTADIIAGEAIRKNPESIDAVINNMLNRVGSKGWGPSKNLLDVATAPGQYEAAWKGAKASPSETEFIRSRIKALASGGVPDNTNGANSYRAESYYRGEGRDKTWARTLGVNGTVVGGNRYTYDPNAANGPYAPYATSKDVPPLAVPAPQPPAIPRIIPKIEGALQNFNDRFNDSMGNGSAFQRGVTAPLGPASNVTNNKQSSFTNAPTNNITINGATQPQQVGEVVRQEWKREHADLLRNLQGSTA